MFENLIFFKFRSQYRLRRKSIDMFVAKILKFFSIILFLLLFCFYFREYTHINLFSSIGVRVSSFFAESVFSPFAYYEKLECFFKTTKLMNLEIDTLKKEIDLLKIKNDKLNIKINDLNKIEKILNIIESNSSECSITRVFGVENIFPRAFLYVQPLSGESIKKDQIVLSESGLVGRVSELTEKKMKIILVTDYYSRVPVIVKETGDRAIVQGQGDDELRVVFIDQPESSLDDLIDKTLVTSGIDDVFPANIPVAQILKNKNGEILAKPLCNFNKLEFVHIRINSNH